MSKYHLGDKFIVEVKEVLESNNGTLYRSNFSTLVFDDYGLDKLQKYDEIGHKLELIDELKQAEYNRGLTDAWELAKKICLEVTDGGIPCVDLYVMFGSDISSTIFINHSYEEALAKIEAYEKENAVCVGDVVKCCEHSCVITVIYNQTADVVFADGTNGTVEVAKVKKTGKHIDIESLLRQIGE